jgi:hypothetical protein
VVEFFDIGCNTERGHGVKDTERVATFEKFVCVALMQSASDEEYYVINHIRVSISDVGAGVQ